VKLNLGDKDFWIQLFDAGNKQIIKMIRDYKDRLVIQAQLIASLFFNLKIPKNYINPNFKKS
jgi:hypothetical protein